MNNQPTPVVTTPQDEDWQRFQHLSNMQNHWDRQGWTPGRQAYFWYITCGHSPELREVVARIQATLDVPACLPLSSRGCCENFLYGFKAARNGPLAPPIGRAPSLPLSLWSGTPVPIGWRENAKCPRVAVIISVEGNPG